MADDGAGARWVDKLPWLMLWFMCGFWLPNVFELGAEVTLGLNLFSVLILWKKL